MFVTTLDALEFDIFNAKSKFDFPTQKTWSDYLTYDSE